MYCRFLNNIQRIILQQNFSPVLFVFLVILFPTEACFGKSRSHGTTRSTPPRFKSVVYFQVPTHHGCSSVPTINAHAFGIVHDCSGNLRWLPCTSNEISAPGSVGTHSFFVGRHDGFISWRATLHSATPSTQRRSVSCSDAKQLAGKVDILGVCPVLATLSSRGFQWLVGDKTDLTNRRGRCECQGKGATVARIHYECYTLWLCATSSSCGKYMPGCSILCFLPTKLVVVANNCAQAIFPVLSN